MPKEPKLIIEKCINGNTKAQMQLYDLYCDAMFNVVCRYFKNKERTISLKRATGLDHQSLDGKTILVIQEFDSETGLCEGDEQEAKIEKFPYQIMIPIQKEAKNIKSDTRLINLLRQAIEAVEENDGWAMLGPIGTHISNHASFDQRNYGFKKLSDWFQAIDLVEMKKTHGSVLWVRDKKRARLFNKAK